MDASLFRSGSCENRRFNYLSVNLGLHFIFMYIVERGSRMFSNLSWGCSSLGEGSVIPFQMHLNGFLKNIPQN